MTLASPHTVAANAALQDLSRDAAYLPVSRRHRAARLIGGTFNTVARLSPAYAASRLNRWVWCRPPKYRLRPEDAAVLTLSACTHVPFGRAELPVYTWGHGSRVVLLVHGWGGAAAQMAHLAPALVEAGYRVVAFDAPAHGAAPGTRTDFPEMTEAVLAVAKAVGPVQAVACHSAGSVAVLRALRQGLRIDRLVLLSVFSQLRLPLAAMAAMLGLSPGVQAAHVSLLGTLYGPRFIEDYSPEHLVEGLRVPGLIVHDRDDREFGAANATWLAGRWPGAQLHLTDGLGHYRLLKDPQVARRVADFISDAA